jgi:cytochrome P450
MIFLLFGAGQETTTHLISGGLLEILRSEDQRRRLQADMSPMPFELAFGPCRLFLLR